MDARWSRALTWSSASTRSRAAHRRLDRTKRRSIGSRRPGRFSRSHGSRQFDRRARRRPRGGAIDTANCLHDGRGALSDASSVQTNLGEVGSRAHPGREEAPSVAAVSIRIQVRSGLMLVLLVIASWSVLQGGHLVLLGSLVAVVAVLGMLARGKEGLYVVGTLLALTCLLVGANPADAGGLDSYGGYCGSVFWPGDAVPGDPEEATEGLIQQCGAVRQSRTPVVYASGAAALAVLSVASWPQRGKRHGEKSDSTSSVHSA